MRAAGEVHAEQRVDVGRVVRAVRGCAPWLQSASSSSARIIGKPVCTPWPNSSRLMVTVTSPLRVDLHEGRRLLRRLQACRLGGAAPVRQRSDAGRRRARSRRRRPASGSCGAAASAARSAVARGAIRRCRSRGQFAVVDDRSIMVRLLQASVLAASADGGADAGIGAAAADVAGHGRVDLGVGGLLAARQRSSGKRWRS